MPSGEVERLARQVGDLREAIGALKQSSANAQNQRATLFKKVEQNQDMVREMLSDHAGEVRETLSGLREDLIEVKGLGVRLERLEVKVDNGVMPVIGEVKKAKQQAIGAGRLAKILWSVGGFLGGGGALGAVWHFFGKGPSGG